MATFEPAMALSAKAKALAQHMLDQQFAKLPEYLQLYIPLLLKLSTAAGIGGSIYWYFQQRNRQKLQLAIFHVLRILEYHPNLSAILQNPEHLALALEAEVIYMVPELLTRSEGDKILKELKRKVHDDTSLLQRHVRPRKQPPKAHDYQTEYAFIERHQPQSPSHASPITGVYAPVTPTAPESAQFASLSAAIEYDDSEDDQLFTPYTAPTWQKPSRRPSAEAAKSGYGFCYDDWSDSSSDRKSSAEAAKSGYGFNYDDWSDCSSSDLKSSTPPINKKTIPAEVTNPSYTPSDVFTQDFTPNLKKSLLERAMDSAFDPNSPENCHIPASHFDKAEACGVTAHKGKAIKPRTQLPRTPPTLGFLSANRDQLWEGTSLSPVDEGDSADSKQHGMTPYRVAETRKFHGELEAQRTAKKEGTDKQPMPTPDKSPGQQEIDHLEQEIREDEEKLGFTVPRPSIADQIISAAKSAPPPKSQSPKSNSLGTIEEFVKKSTPPVPIGSSSPLASIETPSKKENAYDQARVDDDGVDDVLMPDELARLVEAWQQQQDDTPWESPILEFSPSDSGASVAFEPRPDATQSSFVSQARSATPSPEAPHSDLLTPEEVVCVTPKKASDASIPMQALAIKTEAGDDCPPSSGLVVIMSSDRTQALITNPLPPVTPSPAKRGRGRPTKSPKTPKALKSPRMSESVSVQKRGPGRPPKTPKSPKMSESVGVQKRGPGRPRKTPSKVMEEKNVVFVRQSARKTAYKGSSRR